MSVQRMPPFTNARHPQLDPCDPSMNVPEARGVRGREVRGSLGVFTLWLLQRGCPCQRVAMATLFDSYNNARAPLPPPHPPFLSYTHTQTRPVRLEDHIGYHGKVAAVDSEETDNAHAN